MNEKEFEKIYIEYYPKILSYIGKRVNAYQDAEDLVQEILAACYSHFDRYDSSKASVGTWIYVIMSNRLKNYYRSKKGITVLNIEQMDSMIEDDFIEQAVLFEELKDTLFSGIQTLSVKEQKILKARYFKKQSAAFIAEHMGLTAGNVRIITSRAIEKLRVYFQKHGY